MSKKPVIETAPASETDGPPAQAATQEPARDTGLVASIKHAKDFVVDKMSHPKETAAEVKEWAERSAHTVDAALEGAQDTLASVNSSIGEAREWTADKAAQVDSVLAGAQAVVTKLDESVEAVQGSTTRVADALHEGPAIGCASPAEPAEEAGTIVEPLDIDVVESDGAPGARPDRPEHR